MGETVIFDPTPIRVPTDALGRPVVSDQDKARISALWTTIPEGKRAALLIIADDTGARGHVAAKLGDHWRVGAGSGWQLGEKRPRGYIGIEGVW